MQLVWFQPLTDFPALPYQRWLSNAQDVTRVSCASDITNYLQLLTE